MLALPLMLALAAAPKASGQEYAVKELARQIVAHGCPPWMLGKSAWGWAQLGCDAFAGSALVSQALDSGPEERAQAAKLVEALAADALSPAAQRAFRSTGFSDVGGRKLPKSILYRGFVLLLLSGAERLHPDNELSGFYDALAREVASSLSKSPAGFLPTYGTALVWPCDHAPAASGLLLHGELRKDEETAAAGREMVTRLRALLKRRRGFPAQILPSGEAVVSTPRGAAVAWTAGFLRIGDPDTSRAFADAFFIQFCDADYGYLACREWPRGVKGWEDADSGPIIAGYGTAASALGLGAARGSSHPEYEGQLARTAEVAGVGVYLSTPRQYPLENAIYFWARTVRPWLPAEAGEEARP